jgi:hypothetical protein
MPMFVILTTFRWTRYDSKCMVLYKRNSDNTRSCQILNFLELIQTFDMHGDNETETKSFHNNSLYLYIRHSTCLDM